MAGTKPQPERNLVPDPDTTDPIDSAPLESARLRDIDVQETDAARARVADEQWREQREDAVEEAAETAREVQKNADDTQEKVRDKAIEAEAKAIAEQAPEPARAGDILGLSDVSPAVDIPQASPDHGGNPAGIEVRSPTTGSSELRQTKGTDLDPSVAAGPAATRKDLND